MSWHRFYAQGPNSEIIVIKASNKSIAKKGLAPGFYLIEKPVWLDPVTEYGLKVVLVN